MKEDGLLIMVKQNIKIYSDKEHCEAKEEYVIEWQNG